MFILKLKKKRTISLKNQKWQYKSLYLKGSSCSLCLYNLHCRNNKLNIRSYVFSHALFISQWYNTILIDLSKTLWIANTSIWLQSIIAFLTGRLLPEASFLTLCKLQKHLNWRVINYALLSNQRWNFTVTLKMNHIFIMKDLLTVSVVNIVNAHAAHFTA